MENKKSETQNPESTAFHDWALVELFGHQKIVGYVSEATMAGGAFLRVDVPAFDKDKPFTRFFSPGAIYSINPVTEEIARGLLSRHRHEPVSRFELPQLEDKFQPPERIYDDDAAKNQEDDVVPTENQEDDDDDDDAPPQAGHPNGVQF